MRLGTAEGKILVDVALPVRDHQHMRRPRPAQRQTLLQPAQPSRRQLLVMPALPAQVLHAALALRAALEELHPRKAQKAARARIQRDRRVQAERGAGARGPHVGRVLDRQHPPARNTVAKRRLRFRAHLGNAHRGVVQKTVQPDLAGPRPAEPPDTAQPVTTQPGQKLGPLFSRRASPKYPRAAINPSPLAVQSSLKGITNHNKRQDPIEPPRCVNAVGA